MWQSQGGRGGGGRVGRGGGGESETVCYRCDRFSFLADFNAFQFELIQKRISGLATLLVSVLKEMEAILVVEVECAIVVTGQWLDLLISIAMCSSIGLSGQVTLQGSVLKGKEGILEEEEELFAIAVTGEFKATGIGLNLLPVVR